jgi:hypothetical protein
MSITRAARTKHPGALLRARQPWWKERWLVLLVGIAVVVAAMVIVDLPAHSSPASDVTSAQGVLSEVQSDAAPCSYGVHEALSLYGEVRASTLSPGDLSEVPALIGDDYAACSFTDDSINDLASIEEPSSPEGRDLDEIASETLSWCEPDGMETIGFVSQLIQHPGNSADGTGLAKSERQLDAQRAQVEEAVRGLDGLLGTTSLSEVSLVSVR